jgi:hypothetical protein
MKVYLPAIVGYVPDSIVMCLAAFLEACYICRRQDIDSKALDALDRTLGKFKELREVFRTSGVRPTGFSLPRQHSLFHYRRQIEDFGAPGGLCSSITESRHITAVKKPWRRSNRYQALGQMLQINQRLDKLAAMRSDFSARKILSGLRDALTPQVQVLHSQHVPSEDDEDEDDHGEDDHGEDDNGEDDNGEDDNSEDDNGEDNGEDDDDGPVEGNVMGHVSLARTRGMFISLDVRRLSDSRKHPFIQTISRTSPSISVNPTCLI